MFFVSCKMIDNMILSLKIIAKLFFLLLRNKTICRFRFVNKYFIYFYWMMSLDEMEEIIYLAALFQNNKMIQNTF